MKFLRIMQNIIIGLLYFNYTRHKVPGTEKPQGKHIENDKTKQNHYDKLMVYKLSGGSCSESNMDEQMGHRKYKLVNVNEIPLVVNLIKIMPSISMKK